MSKQLFKEARSADSLPVSIYGTFFPDGVAALDATKNEGHGYSVARTNVGEFTVTLSRVYRRLISKMVSLQVAALNADEEVVFGDINLAAGTIIIQLRKVSTLAAVEAGAYDANESISFILVLKESSNRKQ